jgi:hypothetical protein
MLDLAVMFFAVLVTGVTTGLLAYGLTMLVVFERGYGAILDRFRGWFTAGSEVDQMLGCPICTGGPVSLFCSVLSVLLWIGIGGLRSWLFLVFLLVWGVAYGMASYMIRQFHG